VVGWLAGWNSKCERGGRRGEPGLGGRDGARNVWGDSGVVPCAPGLAPRGSQRFGGLITEARPACGS
jgi:hypothetical protein